MIRLEGTRLVWVWFILMEHPFNLKAMVLFSRHFLFVQKQFLRHKVLSELIFLSISETEKNSTKFADSFFSPQKTIAPPPPHLQVEWMFPKVLYKKQFCMQLE